MTTCNGKCCREGYNFIEYDWDSDKWFILDSQMNYVVEVYYCPFCGGQLSNAE